MIYFLPLNRDEIYGQIVVVGFEHKVICLRIFFTELGGKALSIHCNIRVHQCMGKEKIVFLNPDAKVNIFTLTNSHTKVEDFAIRLVDDMLVCLLR